MSDHDLDAFLGDIPAGIDRDMSSEDIEPNFEAMMARAAALAESEGHDADFDAFVGEVAETIEGDDGGVAPDFLAVVTRAHAMDPGIVPQSAVDEVGTYAPIISLQDAARLRRGQDDAELDTFVRDVRGHVDHAIATQHAGGNVTTETAEPANGWRGVYKLGVAAGLLLALGLGAGVATWMGSGGGVLWSIDDEPPNEAMLSPKSAPTRETQVLEEQAAPDPRPDPRSAPKPDPKPEPAPRLEDRPAPQPALEEPVARPRPRRAPKAPSRRDRLAALEQQANAAWQAGRLSEAEAAFRKIIGIDPRGSWGESAYGELFTLQRQRKRSSVALWKAYLKRFPSGRFADDAQAGLCRRAEGSEKVACWTDYLERMPRGSFRRQAQRELDGAKETPE